MRDDQHKFLMLLGQLPARLTAEQAAWVLNCQSHDIPALIAAKLLKPLGHPPANGSKYFATADLLESSQDRQWLVKMSATIYQHWHNKNTRGKASGGAATIPPLTFPAAGKVRASDSASASG
jgi:hypothetical protein